MFTEFRQSAKAALRDRKITYSQLAADVGLSESSIKQFMCGAKESRRVAELMADYLGISLMYSGGSYTTIHDTDEDVNSNES